MTFKSLELPISITTGYQSPVDDFFIPVLKKAITYDVAVGYFTSGWLRDTAEGFAEFALSGGVSRWVVSPQLGSEDAQIIMESSADYPNLEDASERTLFEVIKGLKTETRRELCALITADILTFRIAVPRNRKSGMMHAKLGVAKDSEGNLVAFSGSYNLTAAAKSNWEHMDIFKGWEQGDDNRIEILEQRFQELWLNNDPSYVVLKPSKELASLIKREAGPQLKTYLDLHKNKKIPVELREYQKEAIENWGKNNGRGTYSMATGSGKTITALATIRKLISKIVEKEKKSLVVVIVLPLKHLLEQWYEEASEFGFESIKCYESSDTWRSKLAERMGVLKVTGHGYVIAMVTNNTFAMDHFQAELNKIDTNFLIVADEAHNLGSPTYLKCLPENAKFRLALSATPERYNDVGGTESLYKYFGKPIIEFTLEDAIEAGFLCPYEYHPHLCLMSEMEYEEYLELSELIAIEGEKSKGKDERTKEHIRLLGKRADLISGVESKLEILEDLLKIQHKESGVSHTLVYCGSRRGENNERHIERTVKLIGSLGIKTRKFTAEESMEDRREILNLFSKGELEAIAAIKCLDEGVDVPATRVAYILASTTNPREYIQRRGRVLRKADGKEKAVIHDFLVAPPSRKYRDDDMVERELERAREFSYLALNRQECDVILEQLAEENGVEGWG